ncbi:Os10g0157933 [Oryza sativa Japonica Group]|uniref:Os10g0157933 protein n=1 Tax=Oryza sativa subsp. japonica TaxID=39947 RepID=C7J7U4_ORYSJ|nr:Os10g0157933 [Oryza sativa Japonica Group]|eukprot:NP_001176032.1 Os10g0157933 [Oryza sativa Japonica Group]
MDQSTIDRSWMYAKNLKRHSTEYRKGVINFMNAAEEDQIRRNNDYMCCPCADCKNENMFDSREDVQGHLIQRGFMERYTCWVKHGEQESGSGAAVDRSGAHNQEDEDEHDMFIPSPLDGEMVDVDHDLLQDMLRDVEDPAQNERDGMKFSRLVEQVFDIKDPSNKKMHIVTDGKRQIVEVDNVIDEEEYNHNLHVMGNAWKNFKTKLVGEFVYNPTNPDPREKFPWITEQVWEEFHAKKLTPESRARSEAYRLLQTRNQHPHWLGTAGYAGKEEEWQREDEEAEESNTPLVFGDIPHPRARNWARARYQKNDDGTIFMPNAEDQRVYEAILVAEQQASQEARSQRREDDVLTKALGNKEHRGWTWGVGSSVPWKYGFPDYAWQYKKWTSNKAEKDARLEAKIRASIRAELTSEFDENLESMRAKIRQEIREEQKNPQAAAAVAHEELGSPTQKRSSCASTELAENPTSVDSAVDHIMELTSCTLTVRMMPTFTIPAAEGLAYKPTPETRVHGVQLRADYAKVQVDSVKPEYELFPLKYPPNDEVLSLGNAHGTFIQWRKDLIEIKVTARPTIAPGGRPPKRPASAPSAPPAQDRHAQSYDVQL